MSITPRFGNYDLSQKPVQNHLPQDVLDKGFDLPFPYGVSVLYYTQKQKLDLNNLQVGVNGSAKENLDNNVVLDQTYATNDTVQLKVDAWVFPFLNVYAVAGGITGKAETDLTLNFGTDPGQICAPGQGLKRKALCDVFNNQTVGIKNIEYSGYSVGVGMTLAAGWEQWFMAVPMTYNWSNIDIMSTTVGTINISPRTGYSFRLGEYGNLYPFVGATYLDVDMTVEGSVAVGSNTLDYSLHQENSDKWNALAGFNLDFSKYWAWNTEVGFGGSRTNVITGMTFRY